MNDLESLRTAWGAPEPPSPTARAHARAALLDRASGTAAASPAPASPAPAPAARRRRRGWLFGLGAVGAAAAVGIGFAAVPSSGDRGGAGGEARTSPEVRLVSANSLLDRAADAAEKRPFTPPRPDQWVMIEERLTTSAKPGGVVTGGPYRSKVRRQWTKADGSLMAFADGKGGITTQSAAGIEPRSDYAAVSRMPTDPDALIAWIRARSHGVSALEELNTIMRDSAPPPKVQAAIFRAMGRIPGGTLVSGAKDDAGRPAVAVGWTTEGWLHEEVLFDPSSYAYLGERAISVKRHTMESEQGTLVIPKGTVQRLEVRVRDAVVDRPGQLPG